MRYAIKEERSVPGLLLHGVTPREAFGATRSAHRVTQIRSDLERWENEGGALSPTIPELIAAQAGMKVEWKGVPGKLRDALPGTLGLPPSRQNAARTPINRPRVRPHSRHR
jgi:hypothetical protein